MGDETTFQEVLTLRAELAKWTSGVKTLVSQRAALDKAIDERDASAKRIAELKRDLAVERTRVEQNAQAALVAAERADINAKAAGVLAELRGHYADPEVTIHGPDERVDRMRALLRFDQPPAQPTTDHRPAQDHRNGRTHIMNKTNEQKLVETAHLLPNRPDHVVVSAAKVAGESYGGTIQAGSEAHADALKRYLEDGRWDPATNRVWMEGDGK